MLSVEIDRDMHHIVSKLVTYGSLGLIRDKRSKRNNLLILIHSSSCWPLANNDSSVRSHNSEEIHKRKDIGINTRSSIKRVERVNRAEARKTGNLHMITTLQALRQNSVSEINNKNRVNRKSYLMDNKTDVDIKSDSE